MGTTARYDGFAAWYESEFATSDLSTLLRETVLRLLGEGDGRRVRGARLGRDRRRHLRGPAAAGARARSRCVHANAAAMPFDDASFDAAVSTWIHTDVDDFAAMLRAIARVLPTGAPFVYLGAHPCFVGPHSEFFAAVGVPILHPGYQRTERYVTSPGTRPGGLRERVGATHLPLGLFLQSFLDAGFVVEPVEEPVHEGREYPYTVALACRRAATPAPLVLASRS